MSNFGIDLEKTAFGELSVTQNIAEIQMSAQYDAGGESREVVVGTGSTELTGGEYKASTGTTSGSVGAIFSERQVITMPGQGTICRFTARFPDNAADSRAIAGLATASDNILFGYEGTVFGVSYNHSGLVIVEELQVTTAATGGENATVTVNGTGFTVALTSGTVEHNAFEIAESLNGQTTSFNFTQNGDVVVCRSIFAAPEAGSFAFSSSTAAGTWTQITDGVAPTRNFTAQASWNVDTKPDLDPTKINYYSIRYNGAIEYYIQDDDTGENVLVHVEKYPNTRTTILFSVAAFRIIWGASSQGSTTDISVYGGQGSAFTEGIRLSTKAARSTINTQTSVGTTQTNILSVRCREVFGVKANLGRLRPKLVVAENEAVKAAILLVCKGVTFSSDTDFSYIDKDDSIAEIETTANTVSGGECLASIPIAPGGSQSIGLTIFNDLVLPGEILTVSMAVTSGSANDMTASIIWEEDR